MPERKSKNIREFGDFQTPDDLALEITQLFRRLQCTPNCIVEPTCGRGAFLCAAAAVFPSARRLIGVDINASHVAAAYERLKTIPGASRIRLHEGDFFKVTWEELLPSDGGPFLIIGNPPWVTSSELSAIKSSNLPEKSNFQRRVGIEALTGKSNFDISEWMLRRCLEWLNIHTGTLAMLCKKTVARKILVHAWKDRYPIKSARMYAVDAMHYFGAAVDACLFVLEVAPGSDAHDCEVYSSLNARNPSHHIGFQQEMLIADVVAFERWRHLWGQEHAYTWRSGIKHDCTKVMELSADSRGFRNGLGETIDLEDTFLFPFFKGSDIGNRRTTPRGVMLVPQRTIGEDTAPIQTQAPYTWKYLQSHAAFLNKRASSIYRNRAPFSIFGVGEYSFAPWKVAISGFCKKLNFVKIGSVKQRPAVFDDTVYFLPCHSEQEADFLCTLLDSKAAHEFYHSFIFWADKRPITIDLLKRLSLKQVATELGQSAEYAHFTNQNEAQPSEKAEQISFFERTAL